METAEYPILEQTKDSTPSTSWMGWFLNINSLKIELVYKKERFNMSDAVKFQYWTNEVFPELRKNGNQKEMNSNNRLDYMLHIQWLSKSLRKPIGTFIKKMPQNLKEE